MWSPTTPDDSLLVIKEPAMRKYIVPAFAAITVNVAAFVGLAIASSRVEAVAVTVISTPAEPVRSALTS